MAGDGFNHLFPFVPIFAGGACLSLAIWQAVQSPAGGITLVWLGLGFVLYKSLFAFQAQVIDAAAEAGDSELIRMRGRSPLMLVPVQILKPHVLWFNSRLS